MKKGNGFHRFVAGALVVVGVLVATVGTIAVTGAAFALSFAAIEDTGIAAGMDEGIAWMLPVAIDGMMLVATIAAIMFKFMKESARYPWFVVAAGFLTSVGCNAVHSLISANGGESIDDTVAAAISTIPAVALALSVHLLVSLAVAAFNAADQASEQPEKVPPVAPVTEPMSEGSTADQDAPNPAVKAPRPALTALPARATTADLDQVWLDITSNFGETATKNPVKTSPESDTHPRNMDAVFPQVNAENGEPESVTDPRIVERNKRNAARRAYRASVVAGKPLSGAALGRQYDRPAKWGREVMREVQEADAQKTDGDTPEQQSA